MLPFSIQAASRQRLPQNMPHIFVRTLPSSFSQGAVRRTPTQISQEKAQQQHEDYIKALSEHSDHLISIEPDEEYPDCVFVEDAAVVVGDKALMCHSGHASRQGEGAAVEVALRDRMFAIFHVSDEAGARMDGGDVLFTGKEFFVGVSERTNEKGIQKLRSVFSEYPVHPVGVPSSLHLKSVVTRCGENSLCFPSTYEGKVMQQHITAVTETGGYQYVEVPDAAAANCVYFKNKDGQSVLVYRCKDEYPASASILAKCKADHHIELNNSELAKADGALTCCSIIA
uniref:Dimethylargininase n=1 Tax=Palpitomonas bilix TaxID=652834 RepID=A0A7S3DEA1_9EUKA